MQTAPPLPASPNCDPMPRYSGSCGARPSTSSVRRHRRCLAFRRGAARAGQAAAVAGPLVLRHLVDTLAAGRPVTVAGIGLMVGLGIVRALAAHLQRMHSGRVSYVVEYDLRNAVVEHLSRLDFAAHDALSTGQIMSRASSDVRMIQLLVGFLPLVTGNAVMLLMSLAVMAVLSPLLTAIALLLVPGVVVASNRFRRQLYPATWDAQQKAGDLAAVVEETISGIRVVKAFAAEERELARFVDAARRLYASRMRGIRLQ